MKKYSKIIVAIVIALNGTFAIAVLYVFLKTGAEPTVLVTAWFTFTTGELWLLSGIKKTEIKKGENNENKLETEIDKP